MPPALSSLPPPRSSGTTVRAYSTAATNAVTGEIWSSWNHLVLTTAATTATTVTTWTVWNKVYVGGTEILICDAGPSQHQRQGRVSGGDPAAFAAAREEYQRREAERVQIEREAAAKRAEADTRARRLLAEVLTPEQRNTLEQHGYFDVKVAGRVFRIRRGRSHNVRELGPDGKETRSLCAHPQALVPDYDTMLAQKLMLEHDLNGFLRIANIGRQVQA